MSETLLQGEIYHKPEANDILIKAEDFFSTLYFRFLHSTKLKNLEIFFFIGDWPYGFFILASVSFSCMLTKKSRVLKDVKISIISVASKLHNGDNDQKGNRRNMQNC